MPKTQIIQSGEKDIYPPNYSIKYIESPQKRCLSKKCHKYKLKDTNTV